MEACLFERRTISGRVADGTKRAATAEAEAAEATRGVVEYYRILIISCVTEAK
jgi:hypothetical protein